MTIACCGVYAALLVMAPVMAQLRLLAARDEWTPAKVLAALVWLLGRWRNMDATGLRIRSC